MWECRREGKQRYKSLTGAQCQTIEHDFMLYSRLLAIGKAPPPRRELQQGGLVVNYIEERMEAPHRGRLRRQFQKGFWCQLRSSKHQRQFHMKASQTGILREISLHCRCIAGEPRAVRQPAGRVSLPGDSGPRPPAPLLIQGLLVSSSRLRIAWLASRQGVKVLCYCPPPAPEHSSSWGEWEGRGAT